MCGSIASFRLVEDGQVEFVAVRGRRGCRRRGSCRLDRQVANKRTVASRVDRRPCAAVDAHPAWIIESDDLSLIHCGDTIWHGSWYEIARRHAPFAVAFLPINGVVVELDGFTATDVPATLTPEQAIEAAMILRAGTACAIHHALFQNPRVTPNSPVR
jgi:L-ascorbate metabolism protein UlaG (beta-lactamase superfamily)